MPNFDTGHYFLTLLIPIKSGYAIEHGQKVSYKDQVRALLSVLPTALQSPATEKIGIKSAFTRNLQTHFCRMFVIDDVIYNGRNPTNAIAGRVAGTNLLKPEPVDQLNAAYLAIGIDFDAVESVGEELPATLTSSQQNKVRDSYAKAIWGQMQIELQRLLRNCEGFENVKNADQFADYVRRCQVETTMPFNDYWHTTPDLKDISLLPWLYFILFTALVAIWALGNWLCFQTAIWPLNYLVNVSPVPVFFGGLGMAFFALWMTCRYITSAGSKPMPPGKYADLPSVLKSLYIQQKFSEFAIQNQHNDAERLHAAFGEFLEATQPQNKLEPTQSPGVISCCEPDHNQQGD